MINKLTSILYCIISQHTFDLSFLLISVYWLLIMTSITIKSLYALTYFLLEERNVTISNGKYYTICMYTYVTRKAKVGSKATTHLMKISKWGLFFPQKHKKRRSMFFFLTLFVLFSNGEKKSPTNGKINATQCKDERKASMYSYT